MTPDYEAEIKALREQRDRLLRAADMSPSPAVTDVWAHVVEAEAAIDEALTVIRAVRILGVKWRGMRVSE